MSGAAGRDRHMPGENDPPGEFLNTCEEVHAVWYGFADAISIPKAGIPYDPEALTEPHYYRFGGFVGRIATFLIGAVICYLIIAI